MAPVFVVLLQVGKKMAPQEGKYLKFHVVYLQMFLKEIKYLKRGNKVTKTGKKERKHYL